MAQIGKKKYFLLLFCNIAPGCLWSELFHEWGQRNREENAAVCKYSTYLQLPVYQNGQIVRWAVWRAPGHYRPRTAGWIPQCQQTGCCGANGNVTMLQNLKSPVTPATGKVIGWRWPDVLVAVHVHSVELLLLDFLLIGLVLHALQHLISDVFGQDRQQQFLLHEEAVKRNVSAAMFGSDRQKESSHVCTQADWLNGWISNWITTNN